MDALSFGSSNQQPSILPQDIGDGVGNTTNIATPTPPTIPDIEAFGEPEGDYYETDDNIWVALEFDKAVSDAEDSEDPIALSIQIGDQTRTMKPAFEGRELYFSYKATASDYDDDGFSIPANSLSGKFI